MNVCKLVVTSIRENDPLSVKISTINDKEGRLEYKIELGRCAEAKQFRLTRSRLGKERLTRSLCRMILVPFLGGTLTSTSKNVQPLNHWFESLFLSRTWPNLDLRTWPSVDLSPT